MAARSSRSSRSRSGRAAFKAAAATARAARAAAPRVAAAEDTLPAVFSHGSVGEVVGMVQTQLATLEAVAPGGSRARQLYVAECEAAVNSQANVEITVSNIYLALSCYFARDSVALPGLAKYFRDEADEERAHGIKFLDYQALRGGTAMVESIMMPKLDFPSTPGGDALYSMNLSLSLERLNYQQLLKVHEVAEQAGDTQLCDFVESEFLDDQLDSIKSIADMVTQLERVGEGHGLWDWDQKLLA